MPGFFDALADFKPTLPKKHYLTFGETKIEVSLQQYLEVTRAGIENFKYKDKKIVRKIILPKEQQQTMLTKAVKGYNFYNKDPYWVKGIEEAGYLWKIK